MTPNIPSIPKEVLAKLEEMNRRVKSTELSNAERLSLLQEIYNKINSYYTEQEKQPKDKQNKPGDFPTTQELNVPPIVAERYKKITSSLSSKINAEQSIQPGEKQDKQEPAVVVVNQQQSSQQQTKAPVAATTSQKAFPDVPATKRGRGEDPLSGKVTERVIEKVFQPDKPKHALQDPIGLLPVVSSTIKGKPVSEKLTSQVPITPGTIPKKSVESKQDSTRDKIYRPISITPTSSKVDDPLFPEAPKPKLLGQSPLVSTETQGEKKVQGAVLKLVDTIKTTILPAIRGKRNDRTDVSGKTAPAVSQTGKDDQTSKYANAQARITDRKEIEPPQPAGKSTGKESTIEPVRGEKITPAAGGKATSSQVKMEQLQPVKNANTGNTQSHSQPASKRIPAKYAGKSTASKSSPGMIERPEADKGTPKTVAVAPKAHGSNPEVQLTPLVANPPNKPPTRIIPKAASSPAPEPSESNKPHMSQKGQTVVAGMKTPPTTRDVSSMLSAPSTPSGLGKKISHTGGGGGSGSFPSMPSAPSMPSGLSKKIPTAPPDASATVVIPTGIPIGKSTTMTQMATKMGTGISSAMPAGTMSKFGSQVASKAVGGFGGRIGQGLSSLKSVGGVTGVGDIVAGGKKALTSDKAEDVGSGFFQMGAGTAAMAGATLGIPGMQILGPVLMFGSALTETMGKLRAWGNQLHESNMRFAEFSASMSKVQADSEFRQMKLSQRRGDQLAESAEKVAEEKDKWDAIVAPYEIKWQAFKNWLGSTILGAANQITSKLPGAGDTKDMEKSGSDFQKAMDQILKEGDDPVTGYGRPARFKDNPNTRLR